jgi:hypothetical protein
MTDEPQDNAGDARPKFFNSVTGWIGGLTAVVLALAGLKTAYNQLGPSESRKTAETEVATGSKEAAAAVPTTEAETQADFPTSYTGTWKGNDVTLEWRNGLWVETTDQGEEEPVVINYEQLSRTDIMTNAIDRDRNMYVRWPTGGGTVEESENGTTWTRSYEVNPA